MRPLYIRSLTKQEKEVLQRELKAPSSGFSLKRCQILLSSAAGKKANQIAQELHCSDQTVRNAIKSFEEEGQASLKEKSHARYDMRAEIDEAGLARLRELVRQSPRDCKYETSVWTRPLLAQQLHQEGLSATVVSNTTLGEALKRAGINWRRAKKWIRSPDQHYGRRKKDEIG